MDKQILTLAERLKSLRNDKSSMEDEVKALNAQIEKVTGELTGLMSENELPSFTFSGFVYSLSSRTFASPLAGNKEALYEALRENGYGGLITETVNSNTLSSTVSELMENNGGLCPDWLDGKVSTYDKISVRIAKSTKKS